jgi:putative hydrolase of the HAD superfamily
LHRYTSVFFDLGRTLVYRIVTQERTLRLLCSEVGAPLLPTPDWAGAVAIWRAYHSSHYLTCRNLAQENDLIFREAQLILNHLAPGFTEEVADRLAMGLQASTRWWSLYDDVPPVLNQLKVAGRKTGIISNWEPSLEQFCLKMGLAHAVQVAVSSGVEGIEKPSPRIFQIAMERMEVEPENCLFVGDDYRMDVVGSRAAGMTPVLLDRNDRYLETDCLKIRRIDELFDILRGEPVSHPTTPVCFASYSL